MDDYERTAKAAGRAFSFHPGLWTGPKRTGSWIVGPTFAIYWPEAKEEDYPEDPSKSPTLRKLIEVSGGKPIEIASKPHFLAGKKATCKGRYFSDGGEVIGECAFPLVALARARGGTSFRFKPGDRFPTLYSYDETNVLVAILAGRKVGENCGEQKVSTPKEVSGGPRKPKSKRDAAKVQEISRYGRE